MVFELYEHRIRRIVHGAAVHVLFSVERRREGCSGLVRAFVGVENDLPGIFRTLAVREPEDEGEILFEILPEQGRALHGHYFCNRCVHLCFCVDVYRIGRCLRLVLRGEYYFVAAVDAPSDTAVHGRRFIPAVGPLVCRVDVERSGNSGLRKQFPGAEMDRFRPTSRILVSYPPVPVLSDVGRRLCRGIPCR